MKVARISRSIDWVNLVHFACILESAVRVDADLLVFVIDFAIRHVDPVRTAKALSQSVADHVSCMLRLDYELFGTQLRVNLHRDLAKSDGRAASESDAHD